MDVILAFAVAAVISFWGSLQLGLVNVAVIETTLTRGGKYALLLAIGGVIPEIPYTLLAIYGAEYVGTLERYKTSLGIVIGAILIGIGVIYLLKRSKPMEIKESTSRFPRTGAFAKGFGLAMLNPQLIFFWSGILILIETGSFNFINGKDTLIDFRAEGLISPKWSFAFGAAIGALAILIIYIYLARKYRGRISSDLSQKLNKVVGLFFIVIGLVSIVRNVI